MLCYNHEKFVAESIESILAQSYDNWELIIVDNASADNSKNIINSYVQKDDRITFLPQESNTFPSLGLNIAIKKTKGDYIALLSSDDSFTPQKLKVQLSFMQENKLDFSFTWINAIDSHSKTSAPDVQQWFNKKDVTTPYEILQYYFKMTNVIYAPTVLMKKSLLQNNILHDHRLLQTQDMEYWVQLFKQTEKVAILHKKLTNYRVLEDGENLSSNSTPIKVNRTNFEMIQLWHSLFTLDNSLLSKVFKKNITEDNKYFILYKQMKDNKIDVWQYAILMGIYQKLGRKCDIESPLFKLFFQEYGNFILINQSTLEEKNKSMKWLEDQLESHQKDLVVKDEGIAWLEDQLESHQKDLAVKDEGIKWLENELTYHQETTQTYQKIIERVDAAMVKLEHESAQKQNHILWLEEQMGFKKTVKRLIKFIIGRI
jgi:glycosyltransferase involved in cell wall biosynthesis